MKTRFRITFKRRHGEEYQSRLVDAEHYRDAIKQIGQHFSIRSVTMQCAAVKKNGSQCQRFTAYEYCVFHHCGLFE